MRCFINDKLGTLKNSAPSSSGLGHQILNLGTRVRFPLGPLFKLLLIICSGLALIVAAQFTAGFYQGSIFWIGTVCLFLALLAGLFLGVPLLLAKLSQRQCAFFIFALALVLRLLWVGLIKNGQVSDFAIYQELATALATGKGYAITGPMGIDDLNRYIGPKPVPYQTAYRVPGIPLIGSVLYRLFGPGDFSFKFLNVLLGSLTAVFIFFLLDSSRFKMAAPTAGLLWAVYPPSIFSTTLYGTETVFVFFLVGATLILKLAGDRSWPVSLAAASGILLGWSALMRSTLPFLAGALFLSLWLQLKSKMVRPFLIIFIFILAGIAPWTIRNWQAFQRFVPVCTNEGIILPIMTHNMMPHEIKTADHESRMSEWAAIPNEFDKSKAGYALAREHWRIIFTGGLEKIPSIVFNAIRATFVHDFELLIWSVKVREGTSLAPEENAITRSTFFQLAAFSTAFYLLLLILSFWEVVRIPWESLSQSLGVLFLALFFLAFFAAHALSVGQSRYHFVVMPYFAVMAAACLVRLSKKINHKAAKS